MTADPRLSATVIPYQDATGKFAKGNPGRIPGSKNRISNEALQSVRDMKDDAILQLREKLIAGDWNALQFILERILPRGRLVELDSATPAAIMDGIATGTLTTEEAKNLATVLEKVAAIEEVTELRSRIERLEQAANAT